MQVIILAAGKGTRMGDLAKETPKPMLSFAGKNLIQHKLDALPKEVKGVIIIVGHLKNAITEHFGNSYNGLPISYVEQRELRGTAHALWQAKDLIKGKFLSLMGDDLYSREDLEALARHDHAVLASKTGIKRSGGKIFLNPDGTIRDIIEDRGGSLASPLVSTGAFVLTDAIFSYPLVQVPGRSEYGLPQTILQITDKHKIHLVEATGWKQITSPEDLKENR
jgi:UDP-N-acetylglucosamine diphosphorylase / glucose-1-phosphate thymidylyltransferase / UDP-N-acetylgalactosamine diphosphorylase / glucosamine-1-phosphate N-acetyltransferase / galactosamine-1-phosphate N-acetyltransferase